MIPDDEAWMTAEDDDDSVFGGESAPLLFWTKAWPPLSYVLWNPFRFDMMTMVTWYGDGIMNMMICSQVVRLHLCSGMRTEAQSWFHFLTFLPTWSALFSTLSPTSSMGSVWQQLKCLQIHKNDSPSSPSWRLDQPGSQLCFLLLRIQSDSNYCNACKYIIHKT